MSKPWFLKMALEAEPSPLANRIADILKPQSSSVDITSVNGVANGVAALTLPNDDNRPGATDEVSD